MASIRKEIPLDARAEDVWAAVRDIGALHTRLVPGFVTDTKLESGARIVTFANADALASDSTGRLLAVPPAGVVFGARREAQSSGGMASGISCSRSQCGGGSATFPATLWLRSWARNRVASPLPAVYLGAHVEA